MNLQGSPAHPRPSASALRCLRFTASALAAALLGAACGSDSPPATNNPPATCPDTSVAIPTTCTNEVQSSSLPPFDASHANATEVQTLGVHTVGEDVAFQVPPGTVSFTIVEQAVSAPFSISGTLNGSCFILENTAVPFRVLNPSGDEVFNDNTSQPNDLSTTTAPVVFASSSPGAGTLTVPNTHAGLSLVDTGLSTGTWSLRVSDFAYECAALRPSSSTDCSSSGDRTSTYDVTVITKTTPGGAIPSAGTIDLAIYFATSSAPDDKGSPVALDAGTANSGGDQDLNRMVDTLKGIFARAGITVNGPTYYALPDAQATYATGVNVDLVGACSPLAQLLKNARPGNTLNIFFVSRLTSSDGDTVGVDGTIPGPVSIGGTVASGAAVSVENLRHSKDSSGSSLCAGAPDYEGCGADVTAYILAHEAGHFLGLYHTTEKFGRDFDPLTDTGTCPCATCATLATTCGTHPMSFSECAPPTAESGCGGGDNLMFYVLAPGATPTLKPQQAQVMLANPLVHQ